MLNNRYEKVQKIGQGAYAQVYKAIDLRPEASGRRVADEHLAMFKKVDDATFKPYIAAEMEIEDMDALAAEIAVLRQTSTLFFQNDLFANDENTSANIPKEVNHEEESKKKQEFVAIKKMKANKFSVSCL